MFVFKEMCMLIQQVKIAHLFIQSVSNLFYFYHFKLSYVALHMAIKRIFRNPLLKVEK